MQMRIGRDLASILAKSWAQPRPGETNLSNENLRTYFPLLSETGTAALAWWLICPLKSSLTKEIVELYREAYVRSVAQTLVHERELASVVHALNTSGIRSILLKGWSVGRLYPESGLRPCGDIDLWVDPTQQARAEEVVRRVASGRLPVDLEHDQFRRFETRSFADFYACSETAYLGSAPVQVLRREEQIRILCLHFLKHGGWRPIWLCDIAVLLDRGNEAFNWQLCLGNDPRRARWIGSTIALARDLLAARIPDGAPPSVTSSPPKWFKRTVLQEWSDPRPPRVAALAALLPALRLRPWQINAVMRGRWRNSIQATVDCDGAFDALPRWFYQVKDAASRALHFGREWAALHHRHFPNRSELLDRN